MELREGLRKRFDDLVASNEVVLFMKGTRHAPACGFSASVVEILDGYLSSYETVNVLADPEVRDGIKIYSSWPTIPQLYVKGQFVGGADIVREMHASGDLAKALGAPVDAEVKPPAITVTEAAAKAFRGAKESDGDEIHFEVSARFESGLYFAPRDAGDIAVDAGHGITLHVDRATARRADGVKIDFIEGPGGAGFKIDNPHEPPKVKQITPTELKSRMDQGARFELFDVRTPKERAIASIQGAILLDEAAQKRLEELPRDTPLVFHCHHGGRSQAAAEHFLGKGFTDVSNLRGGIDAWSQGVDPKVPRY
jgi:monothiol glutaredoxin